MVRGALPWAEYLGLTDKLRSSNHSALGQLHQLSGGISARLRGLTPGSRSLAKPHSSIN
jgi:hypothetical protein